MSTRQNRASAHVASSQDFILWITHDIVVAGAGIAGLTAALTAARLGRKTLVLSGDVLGAGNFSALKAV